MTERPEAYSLGTPGAQWYALRLRSNQEFSVRRRLQASGVHEFLPTFREEVRWSDRTKDTIRPLLQGYIFAQLRDRGDFAIATHTRGVINVLRTNLDPVAVDAGEIEALRRLSDGKLGAAPCPFASGQVVTIDSGPLAGLRGSVTRTRGSSRVVVSIEILMRAVSVEFDAAELA